MSGPVQGVDVVLVVGGGRTGTTLIGERFERWVPQAFSVHEPDLLPITEPLRALQALRAFGVRHMLLDRARGRSGVRVLGEAWLAKQRSEEETVQLLRRGRQRYWTSRDRPLVVESYYQWFSVLDLMPQVATSWKAAAVVRDPRTWLRSWLDFGGHYDRKDAVEGLGFGRLTSDTAPGLAPAPGSWSELDTFQRNAWYWAAVYGRCAAAAEAMPDQVRMFRFEELILEQELEPFLAFCCTWPSKRYSWSADPSHLMTPANASRPGSTPAWPDWTPTRARQLDAICGPLMARLGYGTEARWRALLDGP